MADHQDRKKETGSRLTTKQTSTAGRIRFILLLVMQTVMAIELVLLLHERMWMNSVGLLAVMAITSAPVILGRRLAVNIPNEYQVLAITFVFASLFLGEFRSYYARFWWWDVALHTTSGLLLGIVGFLLVFVMNEVRRIDIHMQPGFVALFAFVFAVAGGAVWEIFEFSMDRLAGTNMQKPFLGDPSGLTDTMWDMIVDAIGAALISCFGWWHMKRKSRNFIKVWIEKFIERNPRLFRNSDPNQDGS
ncbi:DUF2238 domain-containing protein (plasmid) [Verrucomicrobiaceae bacterium 227]